MTTNTAPAAQTSRVRAGNYRVTHGQDVYTVYRDNYDGQTCWFLVKNDDFTISIEFVASTLWEAKVAIADGWFDQL